MSPERFNKVWHGLVMPLCARLPGGLSDWLCLKAFEWNKDYKTNVRAALAQSLPKGLQGYWHCLAEAVQTKTVLSEAENPQQQLIETIAQRYFEMMARECCDIYCLHHQGPSYLHAHVVFNNIEAFKSVYNKPGGKLLVLFHFDRLTLISSALGAAGYSHSIITQPIDESNPDLSAHDRRFLSMKVSLQKSMAGGQWYVAGRDTRAIVRALQSGDTLILLPDVRPNEGRDGLLRLPLLGQTLTIPDGVVRLAELTGASMIAGLSKSQGRGCEVAFLPLHAEPREAMAQAVQWLESAILEAPHRWWQWNIFDYLVSKPDQPLSH